MLNKLNKRLFLLASTGFLLFLTQVFLWTQRAELKSQKNYDSGNVTSFLRVDLLPKKSMTLPPVERNIFSPSGPKHSIPAMLPDQGGRPSSGQGSLSNLEKEKEGGLSSWPGYNLSIRYIGYVHAAHKTVGLVIVNGLALAVEEGEFLDALVQVTRITEEEIGLAGPAGEERRVLLEGEKNEKN